MHGGDLLSLNLLICTLTPPLSTSTHPVTWISLQPGLTGNAETWTSLQKSRKSLCLSVAPGELFLSAPLRTAETAGINPCAGTTSQFVLMAATESLSPPHHTLGTSERRCCAEATVWGTQHTPRFPHPDPADLGCNSSITTHKLWWHVPAPLIISLLGTCPLPRSLWAVCAPPPLCSPFKAFSSTTGHRRGAERW